MSGKAAADIEEDISRANNPIINLLTDPGQWPFIALCISKKGYLGLVPSEAQSGDKVVLLSGGSLPFILRPVVNHFQLIGGCYMHGYMKGGAWPDNEEDLEEIIIR